jgi:hypothetical protein
MGKGERLKMNKSTQKINTWEDEFDFKFYGQLHCIDAEGGFDAKPYLKEFIKKQIDEAEKRGFNEGQV